jgi:tryptophan-rich sensory protein
MDRMSALVLFGWLLLCFGAAAIGGFFPPGAWYASLDKPSWNPPSWIFGPVWTLLYILMAVAAWLVWRERGWTGVLLLFLLQLALNAAWSPLFFGLKRPLWGLVDIVALWLAIGATVIGFARVRPLAALLLAPYWAWVTFAAVLNFELWRRNPPG